MNGGNHASITGNMLAAGASTISAVWTGDANFASGTGTTTVTTTAATVTQVSSSLNPSTYGNSVTLASTVNTGGSTPTGSVTFEDGGSSIGTGAVSTVSTMNEAPYSQQIGNSATWGGYCGPLTNMTMNTTAVAAPDGSNTATQFVIPSTSNGTCGETGSSQGALEEIAGGLVNGQSYTISIWARGAVGGESLIIGVDDCDAATFTLTTTWNRYTYSVTNSYCEPTRGFQFLSWQANATYYVWGAQTEVASSVGPYIQTDASPRAGQGGVATFGTSALVPGSHSITSVYGGDSNNSGSSSSVLNQTVNSTTGGSLPTPGLGTVSYQETTTGFSCGQYSQPVTQYEFSNFAFTPAAGGSPIPLSGSPIYFLLTSGTTGCPPSGWVGPNPAIFQGTNFEVYVTETNGSPTISTSINTLTLTPPYSGTLTYGTSLTFIAKQWNSAAAGTITFFDGTTQLATVPLANGTASYTITTQLAASTTPHSISATYNSSNGYPSVSSPVTAETVTPASQSISFAPPSTPVTYGVPPIALSASASSGLPVSFTSFSGPCSVSGSTLTITGIGTCVVAANQTGNSNYGAAPQVSQSVVVNAAGTVSQISSSLNPSTYGNTVTFTSIVNTGGSAPTGSVTFADGSASIGIGTISTISTTNLIPYSQSMVSNWWTYLASETGTVAAPDGSATGMQINASSGGYVYPEVPNPGRYNNDTLTFSVWIRALSGSQSLLLNITQDSSVNGWTGMCSLPVAATTTWQRFSVTCTAGSNLMAIAFTVGNATSAQTFAIWGAQVEEASSAGPYVRTDASPQAGQGGVATFSTSTLAPGSHSITSVYGGDSDNTGSSSSVLNQTVNYATALTVASLSPSSGNVGLAVNISGSGFGAAEGQSTVTFNGYVAGVLNWSDISITAVIPSNATTGPVVVTLADGQTSNNNIIFTVNTMSCK